MYFKSHLFLFFALFLFSAAIHANNAHATMTVEVDAEETAAYLEDAKTAVLKKSEGLAFKKLLSRIAPERKNDILSQITADRISYFVESFKIMNERSFGGKYAANIKYVFNAKRINLMLKNTEGLSSGTGSGTILLFPILNSRGNYKLWEDENIWKKMISRKALSSSNGMVIVPFGDPLDKNFMTLDKALSGDFSKANELALKYGTRNIATITATPKVDDGVNILKIVINKIGSTIESATLIYKASAGETKGHLMQRAAKDTIMKLSNPKIQNELFHLKSGINAKVKIARIEYQNANEWKRLRQSISDIPNVIKISIDAVSADFTQASIYYNGPDTTIKRILTSRGLTVNDDNNYWIIHSR